MNESTLAQTDHELLAQALATVRQKSKSLPWAKKQPWTPTTHIWIDKGLPTIDLHDLSVRLALEVTAVVEETGPELDSGALCLITGRGSHTGGRSRLRDNVAAALRQQCETHGWECWPSGPGRWMLVIDRERAPAGIRGKLGLMFWFFAFMLGMAVMAVFVNHC